MKKLLAFGVACLVVAPVLSVGGTAGAATVGSNAVFCLAGTTFGYIKGPTIGTNTPDGKCVSVKGSQETEPKVILTPSKAVDGLAEGRRLTLVAILVGLALLPLLILLISDWLFTRFTITPVHQVATVPVFVTSDGLRRRDGSPSLFTSRDLVNVPEARTQRVRSYRNDSFPGNLKARGLWNVIRGSKAFVGAPGGSLVVSGTRPYGTDSCRTAPVQFGNVDTWFLTTSQDISPHYPIEGTLVAFVSEQSLSDLNGSIENASWDTLFDLLIDAARENPRHQAEKSSSEPATSGVTAEEPPTELPDWMKTSDPHQSSTASKGIPSWLDVDMDAPSEPNPDKTKSKWLRLGRKDDRNDTKNPPESRLSIADRP